MVITCNFRYLAIFAIFTIGTSFCGANRLSIALHDVITMIYVILFDLSINTDRLNKYETGTSGAEFSGSDKDGKPGSAGKKKKKKKGMNEVDKW